MKKFAILFVALAFVLGAVTSASAMTGSNDGQITMKDAKKKKKKPAKKKVAKKKGKKKVAKKKGKKKAGKKKGKKKAAKK